ncbi:hypothetical protein FISHEDRAFT_46885 [Fistulina hepatica ATCC 64428]|uniref:Uncharacterized protein n=1 Tax=Fistulina hepatica ATCC 64428 TaxID=1128425 RepID=A0A0D7A6P3_9AGAR|nr:hypothetical protein FISHEDRAFT_46885 [Fistulina hepatica ATCC 64428]
MSSKGKATAVKTRRKTKKAAEEEARDGIHEIPDDLDVEALASLVPGIEASKPTSEHIIALYRVVLESVELRGEIDALQAAKERSEVELDQALQDRESLAHDKDVQLAEKDAEIEQLRQANEDDKLESGRYDSALAECKNEIDALKDALSKKDDALRDRVGQIQTKEDEVAAVLKEKRDLVGVISRIKAEDEEREAELDRLRASLKQARQEATNLEATVREAKAGEGSAQLRVTTLESQLSLAQNANKSITSQLTALQSEHSALRISTRTQVTAIQTQLDESQMAQASAESRVKALQAEQRKKDGDLHDVREELRDVRAQLEDGRGAWERETRSLKRLVSLLEKRTDEANDALKEVEGQYETMAQAVDSLERERSHSQMLEQALNGMMPPPSGGVTTPSASGVLPSASRPPSPGPSGAHDLSPTVALVQAGIILPASARSGKPLSFTELYARFRALQDEFTAKCREHEHMERTLRRVVGEIEERAPILQQQRTEYERTKAEASVLSAQLAAALKFRDAVNDVQAKLDATQKENGLLEQQADDLGRQVRTLLKELARRDDPTLPAEDVDMEDTPLVDEDSVTGVITNKLVLFKNVSQLQEQNQKLLRITRELAEKMENSERQLRAEMEQEQNDALLEAHNALVDMQTKLDQQKGSHETTLQACLRERDALKDIVRRLQSGENVPVPAMQVASSTEADGSTSAPGIVPNGKPSGPSTDSEAQEDALDAQRLREDLLEVQQSLREAQGEVRQLSSSLAKANAKTEVLGDRNAASQSEIAVLQSELSSVTSRYMELTTRHVQLDQAFTQKTEDLVFVQQDIERLRAEAVNRESEKKIAEAMRSRLVEENRTLTIERSHLSDLMGNVQRMHNDLQLAGENEKRRLEGQVTALESQAQDYRTQLSQERDTIRQLTLQKDIELKDMQTKLDKSAVELSNNHAALAVAQTKQKHLEERVEDLTKQLSGKEEKLAFYERSGPSRAQNNVEGSDQASDLEAEIADLRAELKISQMDLETARQRVEEMTELSSANELALTNLNATFDDFRSSSEAEIVRHQSEIRALQERLEAAEKERADMAVKYSELQNSSASERAAWLSDKKVLEDTIVDLTTSSKESENDRHTWESEIQKQEERVKLAEEKYSHEIILHAESLKNVDNLKRQVSELRTSSLENQTAAETATAKLLASENSWKQQKEALEKQAADLEDRCKGLSEQNNLLHQHLESVTAQAAKIRQAADADSSLPPAAGEEGAATQLAEMRSIVSYLRKEKEIVDLQLELSKQENTRLKAQLEQMSQSLEESRAALVKERERAVQNATSAAQHAELVERINQLNILRESNSTLRADAEAHSRKARQLDEQLKKMSAQLEPLKEQARVAQAEVQARDDQIKRLTEESQKWQERNAQLLSKTNRVDPGEAQAMKDQIDSLTAEKTATDAEATVQKERVSALENNMRNYKEAMAKASLRARTLLQEKNETMAKCTGLETQLASLQGDKKRLETEGQSASASVNARDAEIASLKLERERLLQEKASLEKAQSATGPPSAVTESPANWEAEKLELIKARDESLAQIAVSRTDKTLVTFNSPNKGDLTLCFQDKLMSRMKDVSHRREEDKKSAQIALEAAVNSAIEKTRNELQTARTPADSDELRKQHEEALLAIRAAHEAELKAAVDAARLESGSATTSTNSSDISAALAVKEIEWQEKRAAWETKEAELQAAVTKALEQGLENGRKESNTKVKLKDAQLNKANIQIRDLHTKIEAWIKEGKLPPDATPLALKKAKSHPASASQPTPASPSVITTSSVTPVGGVAALPHKPTMLLANPTASSSTGATQNGNHPSAIRGASRGQAMRGPVAAATSNTNVPMPHSTMAPAGISILGAAKRPREEGTAESQAKRLRSADAVPVTGAAPSSKSNVVINRNRIGATAPAATSTPPS